MTPCGKQLGDARSFETSFRKSKSSSQASTTCSAVRQFEKLAGLPEYPDLHNNRIVLVFDERILSR